MRSLSGGARHAVSPHPLQVTKTMKRIALIALAAATVSSAFGQALFRNTHVRTNFYGPAGVTGVWSAPGGAWTQPGNTSWNAWPERGTELLLANAGTVSEITVPYLVLGAQTGGEQMTVRVYANDGAAIVSDLGNGPYAQPGTLLFTATVPIPVGTVDDRFARIPVPNQNWPQAITVTAQFTGGNYAIGPFDPATNPNHCGLRFSGTAEVGSNPLSSRNVVAAANHGRLWRRVYTSGGPSVWGCDETTAFPPYNPTFPAEIPYALSVSVRGGNTTVANYVNVNLQGESGFYRALPEFDGVSGAVITDEEAGQLSLEGTRRTLNELQFLMAGNTVNNPNGTFTVSLHTIVTNPVSGDKNPNATAFWTSAPISIPNGLDPNTANTFVGVVPVPHVAVPDEFFWLVKINLPSGSDCGVVTRLTSAGPPTVGQLASQVGWTDVGFFQRNTTNADPMANFIYPPAGWTTGGPGFQYELVGNAVLVARHAVAVDEVVLGLGQITAGNVASLENVDGNALRVCKFFVPFAGSPYARVNLFANNTGITTLTSASVTIRDRSVTAGLFRRTLSGVLSGGTGAVRDTLVTNAFPTAFANYTMPLTAGGGALADYLGTNGRLGVRWEVLQTGPSASLTPCSEIDFIGWNVTE
jgi:hypothetical protein